MPYPKTAFLEKDTMRPDSRSLRGAVEVQISDIHCK